MQKVYVCPACKGKGEIEYLYACLTGEEPDYTKTEPCPSCVIKGFPPQVMVSNPNPNQGAAEQVVEIKDAKVTVANAPAETAARDRGSDSGSEITATSSSLETK